MLGEAPVVIVDARIRFELRLFGGWGGRIGSSSVVESTVFCVTRPLSYGGEPAVRLPREVDLGKKRGGGPPGRRGPGPISSGNAGSAVPRSRLRSCPVYRDSP